MHRFARLGLLVSVFAFGLLLGFVQPSSAYIIYTPADKELNGSGMLTVDFNRDGILDASIQQSSRFDGNNCWLDLVQAYPGTRGAIVATDQGGFAWASALTAGYIIGSQAPLNFGEALMLDVHSGSCSLDDGYWGDGAVHYLGVAFKIRGALHFGWIQLKVTYANNHFGHELTTTLTGYAYETVAGRPIVAGRTS